MFILCSTLAILTSTVLAIDVQAPVEPTSGALTTIHWTPDPAVPVFSMELVHPDFNDALAIANSVNGSLGYLKVDLPAVPADDGYTLQFVNISDIDDVYATSPVFAIAAPPTTSQAPTSALSSTSISASAPA
ncbi:hypothetical protein GGX14DRAFT_475707 [Mycena pura]|uniref:Uncharacterized protein n=1 Tax=Mycena pura TaxID=153505 RepID=A0AAD6Y1M7_9AGAR|nr:hypothetical protein GGX14DRAFT_475707 [Mycena pura]